MLPTDKERPSEKSLEQKAIERYVFNFKWNRLYKYAFIFSGVISLFLIPIQIYLFIKRGYPIGIIEIIIMLMIAGIFFVICLGISFFFIQLLVIGKDDTYASSLSEEKKNTIIAQYISEEIALYTRNIEYCNNTIKPLQNSIESNTKKIEQLEQELEKFEKKIEITSISKDPGPQPSRGSHDSSGPDWDDCGFVSYWHIYRKFSSGFFIRNILLYRAAMKIRKFGWFSNVEVILAACGKLNFKRSEKV